MIPTLMLLACLDTVDGVTDPDDGGTADGGAGDGGALPCDLTGLDPDTLPRVDGACREPELVVVTYVADGDTFVVDGSRGEETVRFIGVNTPETGYGTTEEECYGPEASDFTHAAFPEGTCVWLTFDRDCIDPYDRTLAYVHLGAGEADFFERRLLQGGYAEVMIYDPNDAFEDTFYADQDAARDAGLGLWGDCDG